MQFFETERLVLRNVEAGDADIMYDYRNNETCLDIQYRTGITERATLTRPCTR